jgi:PKD repeat protein
MNFRSLYLGLCLLFFSVLSTAQVQQVRPPADLIKASIIPTPGYPLQPAVFINPMDLVGQQNWDVQLTHQGGIFHKEMDDQKKLIAEKTAAKIALMQEGLEVESEEERSILAVTPVVLKTFNANAFNGSRPPDNSMAISDEGFVVSVINSAVAYYNANGTQLMGNMNFNNFLSSLGLSGFFFDPKVIYDPIEDKFIMVVLSGSSPATSTVVVAFSVSQNPADGWYFYTFNGSFLGNNWFDYPNLGISEHDLFVTGNLFSANDDFSRSVVLQIKKADGFIGGELDWESFNNVQNGAGFSAFTIVPAGYGYDGGYGPGIFMVSNGSFGGGQVYLYEITDSVNAVQQLNSFVINAPNYSSPGSALQQGSNDVLDTGGNRIRNAFYNNGLVHFVYSVDHSNGFSGVRYHRLNASTLNLQTKTFGLPQKDLTYPTVAPFGMADSSQSVMITYLQSSSTTFPGIGAVNCDEAMNFSSGITVKNGESPINPSNDTEERWGDYSGGGRRHNSLYPNAWFVGCYGKNTDYGTWIFELTDDANNSGLPPVANFEGAPRTGDAPHTVTFNDLSNNGVSNREWIFEGGTPATSTAQQVVVNYPDPAKYDVTLIVENDFGTDTLYIAEYVSVVLQPIAAYTANPTSGVAPLTVTFTSNAVNAVDHNWSFPGATPNSSTEVNPTVVYENPGSFNVNQIISNDFGSDNHIEFGYIQVEQNVATEDLQGAPDLAVYPNPISGTFTVDFFIEKKTMMDIYIVDASGRRVKTLLNSRVKAGRNILSFNRNALAAGAYFLIIQDEKGGVLRNETIVVGN